MEIFATFYKTIVEVGGVLLLAFFLLFLTYILYKISKDLKTALKQFQYSQEQINVTTSASLQSLESSTKKFEAFINGSMENIAVIRDLLMQFQHQLWNRNKQCDAHTGITSELMEKVDDLIENNEMLRHYLTEVPLKQVKREEDNHA